MNSLGRCDFGAVAGLWFTPDGTRLVSCGADCQVFTWDVPKDP